MKNVIFALLVSYTSLCIGQPELLWDNLIDNQGEESRYVKLDSSLDVYALGERGSLYKFDHYGNVLYTLPDTVGGFNSKGLFVDNNNDIIIVGFVNTYNNRIKIQKISDSGNLIWDFNHDLVYDDGDDEEVRAVDIDPEGNIYLTGYDGGQFNGKLMTMSVSSTGNLRWHTLHDPVYWGQKNKGNDIIALDSNNVYVVGTEHRNSSGRLDCVLIKYDSNGSIIWDEIFSYHDWVNDNYGTLKSRGEVIEVDSLGNSYIIVHEEDDDYSVILKYDTFGNMIWVTQVEQTNRSFYCDIILDSSAIYIGGEQGYSSYSQNPTLIKMDTAGNVIWQQHYTDQWVHINGMAKHKNGIVMTGYNYDCTSCVEGHFTLRYDDFGNLDWTHLISTAFGAGSDEPYDIETDKGGAIYITGHGLSSFHNMYTFKLYDCDQTSSNIDFINGHLETQYVSAAHYTWMNCSNDSTVLSGIGSNIYTPVDSGNYKVIMEIGNCKDTSTCYNYSPNTGEISNSVNFSRVQFYPNPVVNYLYFESKIVGDYEILDLSGRLRMRGTLTGDQIDLSGLNSGVYFIKFENDKELMMRKFVKK